MKPPYIKEKLPKRQNLSVYKTIFRPILTYSCKSWMLTQSQKSKLQSDEIKPQRNNGKNQERQSKKRSDPRTSEGAAIVKTPKLWIKVTSNILLDLCITEIKDALIYCFNAVTYLHSELAEKDPSLPV